jgi:DNA-binding transcriptional LysR family regulator
VSVELRDIEILLTLADELHFGRTAERLHVSGARVSQAIREQERRIGAALFERTSRTVRLTPLGQRLCAELEPAYRRILDATAVAAESARGLTGTLTTRYSGAWCGDLIAKAAELFCARYPMATVDIGEVSLQNRFETLRSREADLELIELPVDEPDIVVGPILFREPRALIVAETHPLARRPSVRLEDLAGHHLIAVPGVPDYVNDYHLPRHTPSGLAIPQGPVAADWQAILTLVAAGRGVFPTTCRASDYYARPGVIFVPFDDAPPIEYAACWLKTGENAKVRTFVELLTEITE